MVGLWTDFWGPVYLDWEKKLHLWFHDLSTKTHFLSEGWRKQTKLVLAGPVTVSPIEITEISISHHMVADFLK